MTLKSSEFNISLFPFDGINHLMEPLCKRLNELDIQAVVQQDKTKTDNSIPVHFKDFIGRANVLLFELVEHVIQQLPFQLEALPLLIEGESKIIKLLNSKMVVEQFKPTVYSFTHNRYGEVEGTA
ncbi:MAG: hypothetical protein ABUL44_01035, partial [Flavobacterium sp.]